MTQVTLADILKPVTAEKQTDKGLFSTRAHDPAIATVASQSIKFTAPDAAHISSSTMLTAKETAAAAKYVGKTRKSLGKARAAEGATAMVKTAAAAQAALKAGASGSGAIAKPLALFRTLHGTESKSLVGRVSSSLNNFTLRLKSIAAIFFMMATGYKIYESSRWATLSQEELSKKINAPSVPQVSQKYTDTTALKNLVYDYFEEKIAAVLKMGKEHELNATLTERPDLERHINAQIEELLNDPEARFIKDLETWNLCTQEKTDRVEAFGLYIRVLLARQSHSQEIKRVFGKEGKALIEKGAVDAVSYSRLMTLCRQRLLLDTMNFVLGIGVLGLVAFSTSASLLLPLLTKISKSSANFEYFHFAMKALVMGSIAFTPHGLFALSLFTLGFSFYSLYQAGVSKLPFMQKDEFKNYTRYDRWLIHANILLGILSFVTTGFIGIYSEASALTTTALAASQLPWLGLNAYGLSQIWKEEEIRLQEIKDALEDVTREAAQEKIEQLLEEYEEHLVRKVLLEDNRGLAAVDARVYEPMVGQAEDFSYSDLTVISSTKTQQRGGSLYDALADNAVSEEVEVVPKSVDELLAKIKKEKKIKEALALKIELQAYHRALDRAGLIKARN